MSKLRMLQWLWLAALFYVIAFVFKGNPPVDIICQKLGNVTVAAWVGYRIDVSAFRKHITPDSDDLEHIRRAIVMAAAMLAVALGL